MKFNLKRAVDNLTKKNMTFLQPLYEAITNSLEANATQITVNIKKEEVLSSEIIPKIEGFTIEDNGEGFTKINRDSFLELWTTNKIDIGCKGSGRITWLNVFENIDIHSEIVNEKTIVDIPFNINYDDIIDYKINNNIKENKTVIEFNNVTKKYFDAIEKIDNRTNADINLIITNIKQNLLIKLFLLKQEGKQFSIKVILNSQEDEITEKDVIDLDYRDFNIYSNLTKENYKFRLYYNFINDQRNSKKIFYCAHSRIVKEEKDEKLKISCELIDKTSFYMLLTSKYLDDMVNDSRDDFPALSSNKNANVACPLLASDIKEELLKQMHLILIKKFPELSDRNKTEEKKAINSAPFLTKYIRSNTDIVKTEKSLTTKALEEFNKDKNKVRNKFEKLLKDKSIESEEFNKSVDNLSQIAAAELGEYVLYRDNIIKALNEAIENKNKKESFIHNIFMPMRTTVNSDENNDYTLTNMWLLDDKFMTFTNAFSDIRIKKIIEEIFPGSVINAKDIKMGDKRPDLAVFYNKEVSRDALVVEFKGLNVTHIEKEVAITELSRNCLALSKQVPEINFIWAYIITAIDEELKFSLESVKFKAMYTSSNEGAIYYSYNENSRTHMYAIDMNAITDDAFARNKTFLDILKNQ